MNEVAAVPLGSLMATKSGSVDPSKFPAETFDLYSIPAYDRGEPDVVVGRRDWLLEADRQTWRCSAFQDRAAYSTCLGGGL